MELKEKKELSKIAIVVSLGLVALLGFVFWLKGYKLHNYNKFTFYFKNVNGLEPGASLAWNGMKIGVVETVTPVLSDFNTAPLPGESLLDIGYKHLKEAKEAIQKSRIEDLVFARERLNHAQLEIALGKVSQLQSEVRRQEHVQVDVVVTRDDVPIGPLNQVTIVSAGVIGDHYVDITNIDLGKEYNQQMQENTARAGGPQFIVLEPIRFDTLLRTNVESAEAIANMTNRLNAIFKDEDAENIKKIIEGVTSIVNDTKFKEDIRNSAKNVSELTEDFNIWKLIF